MMQNRWLNRLLSRGNRPTRNKRRLITIVCLITPVGFFFAATLGLYPWRDSGRLYGIGSCIDAAMAVWLGLFLLRLVSRTFLQVSSEDRAQMAYAKPFQQLTGIQQDRVKWKMRSDLGTFRPDEQQTSALRDAQALAFRILNRVLPVAAAVYWVFCLSVPIGPMRSGLLVSAVTITALIFMVLSLPEVIRIWAMPDEAREP
jgi:hypothetical protein